MGHKKISHACKGEKKKRKELFFHFIIYCTYRLVNNNQMVGNEVEGDAIWHLGDGGKIWGPMHREKGFVLRVEIFALIAMTSLC